MGLPGHSTTRPSPTPTTSGYQWTRNMPLQAVSPATHPLFLNSLTHKQLQPKVSKQAARKAVATQTRCKPMSIVQTFSASHGPLPCPKKHICHPTRHPLQTPKDSEASSPVSHTVTMQTNWRYRAGGSNPKDVKCARSTGSGNPRGFRPSVALPHSTKKVN